jgi:hypothetical protein
MMAIENAAKSALNLNQTEADEVHFYIDSQAAIKALAKRYSDTKTIISCKKSLNNLHTKFNVHLHWIKAHKGYKGNESADKLAKQGAIAQNSQGISKISKQSFNQIITVLINSKWQAEWQSATTCRQTKHFFPEINTKESHKLFLLNRERISQCVRFITGHNFMLRHQSLINSEISDNFCRLCDDHEPESSQHIICECPALGIQRMKTFGYPVLSTEPEWTTNSLATFLNTTKIRTLEEENPDNI